MHFGLEPSTSRPADQFALESHQKALNAIASGELQDSITPVEVLERFPNLQTGEVVVKTRTVNVDEGPRPDASLEGLSKLKPVFAAKAASPQATAPRPAMGAGALILASEKAVKQFDL